MKLRSWGLMSPKKTGGVHRFHGPRVPALDRVLCTAVVFLHDVGSSADSSNNSTCMIPRVRHVEKLYSNRTCTLATVHNLRDEKIGDRKTEIGKFGETHICKLHVIQQYHTSIIAVGGPKNSYLAPFMCTGPRPCNHTIAARAAVAVDRVIMYGLSPW